MTLVITVSSNIVLELPPAAGMMAGLGLFYYRFSALSYQDI